MHEHELEEVQQSVFGCRSIVWQSQTLGDVLEVESLALSWGLVAFQFIVYSFLLKIL